MRIFNFYNEYNSTLLLESTDTRDCVIQNWLVLKNISDDILIFGRTQEEPDNTLNDTLKALTARGLKLSQSKCEFNRDHITFFGLLFRKSGISPDPTKVSAILESKSPANACELRIVLLFKVHT